MKLSKTNIKLLIKNAQKRFGLSYETAKNLVKDFQNLLEKDDLKFIYELNYAIFHRRNHKFTKNILNSIVETYVYLYAEAKTEEDKETIRVNFEKLFDMIFIERCQYSKRLEEKSHRTQKILQHTTKRLNETLETQELMIANISHEMRTSLNAISGYLTIINDRGVLQGEDKQYLNKATHATRTLKALVSDILSITKINSGQLEIQKEDFWLDRMLLKCIDNIALMLKKKPKVQLQTDIEFVPYMVYGDQNHIMEIIINILSNAVKYTDGGYIKLKMHTQKISNEYIMTHFVISDSGIGMTKEQLSNIFSPYSRFKTERQGLGLGMHIAHQLAKKLDGTLSVHSEYQKGSIFTFSVKMSISKKGKIDVSNRRICFFCDKSKQSIFQKRVEFLQKEGAFVELFHQENEFVNYLLTLDKDVPDFISIASSSDGYAKYDALIYYLKSLPIFTHTTFIAESINQHLSLNYFDEVYEHFSPITLYIRNEHQQHKKDHKKCDISILAVDDTETNLDILKLFISKQFPHVTLDLASGGYGAIGMFKIKKYDMVMLDLKMPGLNGFEVFEKLKKIGPLPPVYAFSADIYKSNIDKVEEVGFAGLIEKPLQPQKLYNLIERIANETDY